MARMKAYCVHCPLNAALLNGMLIALVMGGAILPPMCFFQNVQGLKPVPALLRTRLAPTGLSLDRIREVTRAWREAVGESASTVARVFAAAAVVSLACAALAWFGIRPLTTAAQGERS